MRGNHKKKENQGQKVLRRLATPTVKTVNQPRLTSKSCRHSRCAALYVRIKGTCVWRSKRRKIFWESSCFDGRSSGQEKDRHPIAEYHVTHCHRRDECRRGRCFRISPPPLNSYAAHQNSTLDGARWVRTRVRTAEFYSRIHGALCTYL